MIQGAVFDMDGLMFDSERIVYEIWQEMMDEHGYSYSLDVFKNTIGLRRADSEKFYQSRYGRDFDYNSFKKRCRSTYMERVERGGVPVKKGLIELLDFLKSRKIRTAVATSTSAETAHKVIRLAGVYDYFDCFVCGDEVTKGKPNPEIFLKAADKIRLSPESCIAFEDSINGIKSAYGAKMTTVMVPDFLQPNEEIKPMINCLCKSLDESIDFIKSILPKP